jgi:hypothetical protein
MRAAGARPDGNADVESERESDNQKRPELNIQNYSS